ncbi:MAG: hypothetical protein CML42_00480 [Rhodobacteraceae bacterium]|nr:hypothetical protein [Paracoccaceae bacterium]|tara:strand:- start:7386 stop:8060 length:675 start_codon:yes stop_codon:yes gene_type:complete
MTDYTAFLTAASEENRFPSDFQDKVKSAVNNFATSGGKWTYIPGDDGYDDIKYHPISMLLTTAEKNMKANKIDVAEGFTSNLGQSTIQTMIITQGQPFYVELDGDEISIGKIDCKGDDVPGKPAPNESEKQCKSYGGTWVGLDDDEEDYGYGGGRRRRRRRKRTGRKSRKSKRRRRKSRKSKRRKSKVGSKSNPYKNKTRCMKGSRKGKVFYKRKGRVVSMKKK